MNAHFIRGDKLLDEEGNVLFDANDFSDSSSIVGAEDTRIPSSPRKRESSPKALPVKIPELRRSPLKQSQVAQNLPSSPIGSFTSEEERQLDFQVPKQVENVTANMPTELGPPSSKRLTQLPKENDPLLALFSSTVDPSPRKKRKSGPEEIKEPASTDTFATSPPIPTAQRSRSIPAQSQPFTLSPLQHRPTTALGIPKRQSAVDAQSRIYQLRMLSSLSDNDVNQKAQYSNELPELDPMLTRSAKCLNELDPMASRKISDTPIDFKGQFVSAANAKPLDHPPMAALDSATTVTRDKKNPVDMLKKENSKPRKQRAKQLPDPIQQAVLDYQDKVFGKHSIEEDEKPMTKGSDNVIASVFLSPEQRHVMDLVVNGKNNVFFTGAAGTGKSVLLRHIIKALREKHESDTPRAVTEAANTGRKVTRVAVTASTGLAACNIGGVTLHSFAGIGLGKEDVETLIKKIRRNRKIANRWKQVKALIIDEISMVNGELFDKLDEIGRAIRKRKDKPFGGMQIVVTGDFYQLPPVPEAEQTVSFIFESRAWKESLTHAVELKQVFRQKDDRLSSALNQMRKGVVNEDVMSLFRKHCQRPLATPEGISATELYPRKADVEVSNQARLRQLSGKSYDYECEDWNDGSYAGKKANLDNLMCVPKLSLKVGAQVMMIKNIDETLVNGTIGTVVGFMSESSFNLVHTRHLDQMDVAAATEVVNNINAKINNVSQINQEEMDEIYGPRKGGSEVSNALRRKYATIDKIKADSQFVGKVYPLVRYSMPNGTFRTQLAQPETWKIEDYDGKVVAQRTQVPLILAWAISIHKAQGQTLPHVKVDLSKVFEKGQSYVALSRATNLDGLQVLGFSASKVRVDNKVIEFYDSLKEISTDGKLIDKEEEPQRRRQTKDEIRAQKNGNTIFSAWGIEKPEDHPREPTPAEETESDHEEIVDAIDVHQHRSMTSSFDIDFDTLAAMQEHTTELGAQNL